MSDDEFIVLVEEEIKKFLDSSVFVQKDISGMQKAAELLCLGEGAKRIRSSMIHFFGCFLDVPLQRLVTMASSAELIHVASLLHDDVIDMSARRRGEPAAHITHGNTIAVLTGDLLYSQALEFLENTSMEVFKDAIRVVKEMTISASIEYNQRGNPEASIQDWERIALGKTARLFSWCTKAPAILARSEEQTISHFGKAGLYLGLAFQLADDIKDFFAGEEFGKGLYSDIQNQNTNYVLIKAMNESSEMKSEVKKIWNSENSDDQETSEASIRQIGDRILKLDSFQESLAQLKIWIQNTIQTLEENNFSEIAKSVQKLLGKILRSLPSTMIKQF